MYTLPRGSLLAQRLAAAERVVVLTGAGISAESGIPTFRDPGGLWQQFKPEELANVQAFLRNPVLVQAWYAHRQHICANAQPNAGHDALARLEQLVPDFTLITQNVDDLHRRAGSRNVVELHGNLTRSYCISCKRPAGDAELEAAAQGEPAHCRTCGGLIRPDVVWFGEYLPEAALRAATEATERADVFLSVGTSAVVYPAAGLIPLAADAGAYVAEVNIEPGARAQDMHEVLVGPAATVLPALLEAVLTTRHRGA